MFQVIFQLVLLLSGSQSYFIGPKSWSPNYNIQLTKKEDLYSNSVSNEQMDLYKPEEHQFSNDVKCYIQCQNWTERGTKAYKTCIKECLKKKEKIPVPWRQFLN